MAACCVLSCGELRPSLSSALTIRKAPSSSSDLVRKASISSLRDGADFERRAKACSQEATLSSQEVARWLPSEKMYPAGNVASLPQTTEESSNGCFKGEEVLGLLLGSGSLVP